MSVKHDVFENRREVMFKKNIDVLYYNICYNIDRTT